MFLFAVSETVWLAVIGIVALIVKEVFDERRANRTAAKVETVKTTLETVTTEQGGKLKGIEDKLEVVHLATNSMKDALVSVTEKEALARGTAAGIQQEKDSQNRKDV